LILRTRFLILGKKVKMKNQTLFKYAVSLGLILVGCGVPAVQPATIAPAVSSPTSMVTPSPTETTVPLLETVWKTNGNPNAMRLPTELAVDSQGNVYVIDGDNHRIQKFDKDGNFLLMWGGLGAGDGKFLFHTNPDGFYGTIAVDENDDVYVGDHHNRVQKFDSNGNFLMKFGGTGYDDSEFAVLGGIAVNDQGNIYTVDWSESEVQKFDDQGTFLQKWDVPSCKPGGTSFPHKVVLDGQGRLYIPNAGGSCIQIFDDQGNLLQQWGELGKANGQFDKPRSLALDGEGNIYVSDNINGRIQKFDPDGNFRASFGPFEYPVGIAMDSEGFVYLVEVLSGQLQKLRLQ
jgi:tripartite motif-containing protein 71